MNFRILKGTHVSHFHSKCPLWPSENFYEQDKPLWWGKLCTECASLADSEFGDGALTPKASRRRS